MRNVFHVSTLKPYAHDPSHVLDFQDLSIQDDISIEDRPIQILDRREQVLRNKVIPLVKVMWSHHGVEVMCKLCAYKIVNRNRHTTRQILPASAQDIGVALEDRSHED